MKLELILKFEFQASHSLSGNEAPHPHLWRLNISVSGKITDGKIIDMVFLRSKIEEFLEPIKLTYLNENMTVSKEVKEFPTCETLCLFFFTGFEAVFSQVSLEKSNHPAISLNFVSVAICDLHGCELGAAKLSGASK